MKIKYIVFALLTLPSMALAAKIDTSSISSANDMDMAEANLWSVFKTRSESVDKQLIASETERIEAAITAGKDAFANKDVSKLKDPTKDKLSARNRNAKNNRRNNNNNNNGDADDLTGNENANNSAVVASGLGKLSDADMAKRHDELQKNYQNMKDKEQSAANKAIGAVGIGAGGIGTMMLSQSLAEKQADEAAERDMKAYLQTFKCDYGQGPNIRGGTENVELPGANTLLPLYQEYMALAEDLKIRKEALGMKPGIESEVILDKANMGLYDDVNLGIEGGAYASLSRAMRNPEGEDASLWQAQKDKTKQNMIIGASVAAAGLIGSGIANLAVNKNAPKENSDAINANYDSMREQLVAEEPENLTTIPEEVAEEVLEENPEEVEPDYSNEDKCINSGGEYRHGTCDCTNMGIPGSAYEKDGKCECDTDAGFELIDNKCQCKLGSGYNDTKNKCVVCATLKQAISNDGKCVPCDEQIPGTEWNEDFQTCICDIDPIEEGGKGMVMFEGECIKKPEPKVVSDNLVEVKYDGTIVMKDATFDPGEFLLSKIPSQRQMKIAAAVSPNITKYDLQQGCLVFTGYADNTTMNVKNVKKNGKTITIRGNEDLSRERAITIKELLQSAEIIPADVNVKIIAKGDKECSVGPKPKVSKKDPIYQQWQKELSACRRVELKYVKGECPV